MLVPGSNGSTFLFTFLTQGGTTEGAYTSAEAEMVVDSEKKIGHELCWSGHAAVVDFVHDSGVMCPCDQHFCS